MTLRPTRILKPRPIDYTWRELRSLKCAAHGCELPAATTFYLCALAGYLPVCKAHDISINKAVLACLTTSKETTEWIQLYRTAQAASILPPTPKSRSPVNSPTGKSSSPARSAKRNYGAGVDSESE